MVRFHVFDSWVVFYCVCVCVCVYICTYVYHIFFIHSLADRDSGCFHILAIINSATMNIVVYIFLISAFVFFKQIPRGRIAESYGSSILNFLNSPYCFPQWLPIYIPNKKYKTSLFSTSLTILISFILKKSYSKRSEVIPHCSFDLHFYNN